jgi:hypothetical protein
MNRRLIISLFIAGAFAFACGPRSHTDASTAIRTAFGQSRGLITPANTGSPRRSTTAGERDGHEQTLAAQFDVTVQENEVLFVLDVRNAGPKKVEVTFPSGQAYDFVVVDSAGRQVWRWADGHIFTQSVRNKLLGRGQSIRISERWRAPTTGQFTAIATLKSTNYPVEQRWTFSR